MAAIEGSGADPTDFLHLSGIHSCQPGAAGKRFRTDFFCTVQQGKLSALIGRHIAKAKRAVVFFLIDHLFADQIIFSLQQFCLLRKYRGKTFLTHEYGFQRITARKGVLHF